MKIIKFYSDCVLTLGAKRAVIIDLTRERYMLLPLAMAKIMLEFDGKEHATLVDTFEDQQDMLNEYLNFLEQHEFVFWCDSVMEANSFTPLNTQWDFPGQISNAIVALESPNNYDIGQVITSLEKLGCQFIKLVITNPGRQETLLLAVLELLKGSLITSVEVNLTYKETLEADLLDWMTNFPRLLKAYIFLSPETKVSKAVKAVLWEHSRVIFSTAPMSLKGCGQVHWAYFTTNITHYTESLTHNTCLNRKVSIDASGFIRNCLSMGEHFGNVSNTSIKDAVATPAFQKYWDMTKDQIDKCKDCEFRNVCTDCRAFVEKPYDVMSAPLKCGYDPYNCTWEDWSSNPLKHHVMEYYGIPQTDKQV